MEAGRLTGFICEDNKGRQNNTKTIGVGIGIAIGIGIRYRTSASLLQPDETKSRFPNCDNRCR
jgi:hypothetical protein